MNVAFLCVVIFAVSAYFVFHETWTGVVMFLLGGLCLVTLIPFGIDLHGLWPDIAFGLIDNGILALLAILGGAPVCKAM